MNEVSDIQPGADGISPGQVSRLGSGSVIYPAAGTHGPRVQQDWQLVLLHSGHVRIQVDDQTIQMNPGQICLLEPGHREFFQFSRERESWHRWISLRLTDDLMPLSWHEAAGVAALSPPMNQIMDAMLDMRQHGFADDSLSVIYLGLAAMALFLGERAAEDSRRLKHPALERMAVYIRRHYTEKIDLDDLAGAAGLSREYLVRLNRQVNGRTPMQQLWAFRLEQGIDLIKNSGLSIGDIADRCGFAAYNHFARSVRRATGRTPGEIRRSALQADHLS